MHYTVRVSYKAGNEYAIVTSEDVYDDEAAAFQGYSHLRGEEQTISGSLTREREMDGQIESVVLDMYTSADVEGTMVTV